MSERQTAMVSEHPHHDAIPTPTSIAEVEQLVKQLYSPGSPALIGRIQETLQRLQRSPEGWQLADTLLGSADINVRFFGALTFTVKLNSDWESLDEDSIQPLLTRLISWFIRLVSQGEGSLVIKKLCSSLVAFFLRPKAPWARCIRHLLCCLCVGETIAEDSIGQFPSTPELMNQLNPQQYLAAIWFSSTLVDELEKINVGAQKLYELQEKIEMNVADAVALIKAAMASKEGTKLNQESIKCYHSWLVLGQSKLDRESGTSLAMLRSVTPAAVECLMDDELFEATIDMLTDTLASFSSFFTAEHFQILFALLNSPWAQDRLSRLKGGDFDFDLLQFGRFILALGDAIVQDLIKNPDDPNSQSFMQMLHDLLRCEGRAVAEDEICVSALEFWNTYIEFMIDSSFADGEKQAPWTHPAKNHVLQAIEECWAKVRLPPPDILVTWDADTRRGFQEFRRDVNDLLQSSYTVLGLDLFERLGNLVLVSLEKGAWDDVEATLFCLNALADSIPEDGPEDAILARVFGSAMFPSLSDPEAAIPAKARQTAVNMLGHYCSFFERHMEHLPSALNFLFTSLRSPALAVPASKSISSLCSSCRMSLTSELGAFLQQYGFFLAWPSADQFTKEKVIGAIAAIIEALPSEDAKAEPIQELLNFVEQDVSSCLTSLSNGDVEAGRNAGLTALGCLASMGKALQAPDDVPVDLDDSTARSTFWDLGTGLSIQERIVNDINTLTGALSWDGEVIEAACHVLRTGFKETTPGPFVFPARVTVDFVLKSGLNTPRVDFVLTTACVLLTTHLREASQRIDDEAEALCMHAIGLMQGLGTPDKDPEIACSCVDVVTRLIPRYLSVLLRPGRPDALEFLFLFTIACLRGDDILPKRSAASFWSSFVVLADQPPPLQSSINGIMAHLGPQLTKALIRHISGEGARSELDTVTEPFKKLIFRQARAKAWIEAALFDADFPATAKVGAADKRAWLLKVMSLRGAKGTNQAVKDFWIACRGTGFAYASSS
ncbi:MAG: hypothetical protein M1819_007114 [Sarea resinae]|nr:MAG: hypothetical protein M1819_007114 [Sarea resinae]